MYADDTLLLTFSVGRDCNSAMDSFARVPGSRHPRPRVACVCGGGVMIVYMCVMSVCLMLCVMGQEAP